MCRLPAAWLLLLVLPAPSWAGEALILDASKAAERWSPQDALLAPYWPPALAESPAPACVNLGFLIAKDGSTTGYVVLRAWSARDGASDADARRRALLAQSAAAAATTWHFTPAAPERFARKPVFTSTTIVFGADDRDRAATAGRCAIANLPSFVAQALSEAQRRGGLLLGRMDRKRVSAPRVVNNGISPNGNPRTWDWAMY
jgi:hypothetical protein